MMVDQILINPSQIFSAVKSLMSLMIETKYSNMDPDIILMNNSISETSDSIIEMYQLLQESELVFRQIIQKTFTALNEAGISFQETDKSMADIINDLPYAIIY